MSLTEYKKHFSEHTKIGPEGVIMLSKVQQPLRDTPLDEYAQGQFRNLVSQCRKKTSIISAICGGTAAAKALLLANLAVHCHRPVVVITNAYLHQCEIGDLPSLFAQLANQHCILFFTDGDDLLSDEASSGHSHIDKDALLKLVSLRQDMTLFCLKRESVISTLQIRSPYVIEIATT